MGLIQGIGVDIVDVERMREAIENPDGKLAEKVFTENETSYCRSKKNPYQHFAARFAAKEAVSKAVKIGWSGAFRWKDVEVVNDDSGAPSIVLYNEMAKLLENSRVHLSLSHTQSTVVAFAVIESL